MEIIREANDKGTSKICDLAVAINCMARYSLTGSRVSLSVSTRVKGMHGKGETNVV